MGVHGFALLKDASEKSEGRFGGVVESMHWGILISVVNFFPECVPYCLLSPLSTAVRAGVPFGCCADYAQKVARPAQLEKYLEDRTVNSCQAPWEDGIHEYDPEFDIMGMSRIDSSSYSQEVEK
jgi:hypothetical protein